MSWRRQLAKLRALFRDPKPVEDLDEEIRSHLRIEEQESLESGVPAEEAHYAALRSFGNVVLAQESSREMWGWSWLEESMQNVRYGLRALRRSPGLAIVAVVSLALGIGANTAIFSFVDAVMLRSLPVENPSQLVLFGDGGNSGSVDGFPDGSSRLFSYPFYREIRKQNQVFSGVTAVLSLSLSVHGLVAGNGSLEAIKGQLVSGTYFSVLGVNPVLGRTLSEADDQVAGAHPVAVASYAWWKRRFDRDPSIVGKTVTIESTVYTIVGVAPPEFFGTMVGESPDLWVPLAMEKQLSPGWNGLDNKLFQSLYIIARLKTGLSMEQASTNVNLLFKQILHDYAGPVPSQQHLDDIQRARIDLTPVSRGLSRLRYRFSEPLEILLVVVGLVLLIACANIANLLLARSANRYREIAVRQALGAGRSRLVRQLMTESLLLALAGGAVGIAFASWASHLLLRMATAGPELLPLNVAIDLRLLAFTFAVSVLTAVPFGIAPALRATRLLSAASLKEGRGTAGAVARSPLARGLLVSQVAISLVLLVAAGLFLRTLVNLTSVDTGFDRNSVLCLQTDASSAGYKEDARVADLYQRIEQRVSAVPGVKAASVSFFTFGDGSWIDAVYVQGGSRSPDDVRLYRHVSHNLVGNRYFAAMGIPLLAGRAFGPQDTAASPKVAIINETMARVLFPGRSPIGRRFGMSTPDHAGDFEVAGVVKDTKYEDLREEPKAADYFPYTQRTIYMGDLEVRYSGDYGQIASAVRRVVADVDHNLPISNVTTLAAQVDRSVASERLVARLSAFFGLLAVFLACIGIYGLMSYSVARRTNEIGVRMALGAARASVMWLVMREILLLVGLGLAIGIPVTVACRSLVSTMLFGLSPTDPVTLVLAPAILLAVAVLAGYLPARRASRVDPMIALRYE